MIQYALPEPKLGFALLIRPFANRKMRASEPESAAIPLAILHGNPRQDRQTNHSLFNLQPQRKRNKRNKSVRFQVQIDAA
jgi:hypothetical protein